MKLAPGFWQGAAAASSLLLAGGYVACSAGLLRVSFGETPNESPAMFSSSKVRALVPAIEQWNEQSANSEPTNDAQQASWQELTELPHQNTIPAPPAFLGGSKSVILAPTPSTPTDTAQTIESNSIMVGSKSPAVRPFISPPPPPANPSKLPTKQ